jgi:uncharacterized membrane protein YkvA (DUF1232 family)
MGELHPILEVLAMKRLMLFLALWLLYLASPIDLVPDMIPIVGWLDDIGLLGYLGYALMKPQPQ